MEIMLFSCGFYYSGIWWIDIIRINDNTSLFSLWYDEDGLEVNILFIRLWWNGRRLK